MQLDRLTTRRPNRLAMTVHALGWLVLLATVALIRSGILGVGLYGIGVGASGLVLFATMTAWGAARIVADLRIMDAFDVGLDLDAELALATRSLEPIPMTAPVGRHYGSTTITLRTESGALAA